MKAQERRIYSSSLLSLYLCLSRVMWVLKVEGAIFTPSGA